MSNQFQLTEIYDNFYLKKLANITHKDIEYLWKDIIQRDKDDLDIKTLTNNVRNLCKTALQNNNTQIVDYKYSKKTTKSGRLYSTISSYQNIPCQFRGLLGSTTALDFDAKNCHPVLLSYLCKKHYIGCDVLDEYINNRDDKVNDFIDDDDLTKFQAKMMFFKSINYDRLISKKDKKTKIKNKFFLEFDKQIKQIQKALITKYKDIHIEISKVEKDNIDGKTIARLLNTEEGIMLEETITYLQEKNYIVMTRCFDGVFLNQSIGGKEIDVNKVIEYCEEATKKWNMVWTNKNHDLSFQAYVDNIDNKENVIIYSKTETDLVKDIYEYFYKDILFKANGVPNLLIEHQWNNVIDTIEQQIYKDVINTYGYIEKTDKDGEIKYQLFTQSITNANSIVKLLMKIIPENKKLIEETEKNSLYKISFKNGYWDFRKGEFIEYVENDNYRTINMIDRDFEYIPEDSEIRKELFEKILYKMFCIKDKTELDYHIMEDFLHKYGRAMCGIMSDKIWFYIMGERYSCKGLFDTLMRNSFEGYIGNFHTASLELENKCSDMALKQKFILKNKNCRLAISQEISENWICGNLLKKVASGGDRIDARNLYNNTETFQNVCKYALVGNVDTRIKPIDALSTRWYYKMKSIFVKDLDNIEEKLNGFTYYQQDDSIKDVFIYRDDIRNAMCSVLFDYFKRKDTYYPQQCIKSDDANIDPFKEARLLFSFDDKDNTISNNELKAIYNRNKDNFDSLIHLKKVLRQLGAIEYRNSNERGLKGVICK